MFKTEQEKIFMLEEKHDTYKRITYYEASFVRQSYQAHTF